MVRGACSETDVWLATAGRFFPVMNPDAPKEDGRIFRGTVSLRSFFHPSGESGSGADPQVGMTFGGTVELFLGHEEWLCRYDESSYSNQRSLRQTGAGDGRSNAPFADPKVFWSRNGLIQSSVSMEGITHLAVDVGAVPPSRCSCIPEIMLGTLDARGNARSELLLGMELLSEISPANKRQSLQETERTDRVHSWEIHVRVQAEFMGRVPEVSGDARPDETRVSWMVARCSARLFDDHVESLDVCMTRYCRGGRGQDWAGQPSVILDLNLTRDRSQPWSCRTPSVVGPTWVSDHRFKARGNGVSPVTYRSVDGFLLPESSEEVAAQLAALREGIE